MAIGFFTTAGDNERATKRNLSRFIRKFGPLFAISLFLPFLIFLLINTPPSRLSSQAGDKQLRLWLEPASVQTYVNQPVRFSVIADTTSEATVIHSINLEFFAEAQLQLSVNQISQQQLFSGRRVIGEVTATPTRTGNFELNILKDSVMTNETNLQVFTSPATIQVIQ